jgi:hypothetical protein
MAGRCRSFLLAFALLAPAAPAAAQLIYVAAGPGPTEVNYGRIHVINSATGHLVHSFEFRLDPRGPRVPASLTPRPDVVVSADGRTAYVSAGGEVVVIDTLSFAITARIPAGIDLSGLAMSADGSRIYVADRAAATIVVVDTASKQVDGESIPTPSGVTSLAVSPDGARLYAVKSDSPNIYAIDVATRRILDGNWATGTQPLQLTVHPDGSRLYVVHRGSTPTPTSSPVGTVDLYGHNVTAYDTTTFAEVATVKLPAFNPMAGFVVVEGQPGRMSILPSGSRLYVPRSVATWRTGPTAFFRAERVDVIDTATLSIAAEIPLTTTTGGTISTGIWSAVAPEGSKVIVAGSGPAVTIDTTTHAQTPAGPGVEGPTGMAVAPAPPCWFEFPVGDHYATGSGRHRFFEITAPEGCAWAATTSDSWIGVVPASGTGPGMTAVVVAPSEQPRNGTFTVNGQTRNVKQVIPTTVIDTPAPGSEVTLPFDIGGWSIIRDAGVPGAGTGVVAILLNDALLGVEAIIPMAAPTRGPRPDVAALYGERYALSGYTLRVGRMAAGTHRLHVTGVSAGDALASATVDYTVRRAPVVVIDAPAAGAAVSQPFTLSGWAADMTVPAGSGVDVIHVWAYPAAGGDPVFVGATPGDRARADVAAFFNEPTLAPGFELTVSTLPPGRYTIVAYAHCTATNAFDVAASVEVAVDNPQPPAPPFGVIDTPSEGALVSGAMQLTGWALDDTAVTRVAIYRDPAAGEAGRIYIGDATFVEGSRPDVAAFFPAYPRRTRAGWGLSILTNVLPDGGNGMFTFEAEAHDTVGNIASLGRRTVLADNATSQMPFGTIDTPGQGATVSGTILNWAWALTPGTATIPTDGSTIDVLIDNVVVGRPTRFGLHRADIAALFPGYTNSDTALGYYVLDTTTLSNGIHTIAWVVRDDMGRAQGIGSRYFFVQNPATVQHGSTR